jgi:uncharacterized protein (TIGR03086 family)
MVLERRDHGIVEHCHGIGERSRKQLGARSEWPHDAGFAHRQFDREIADGHTLKAQSRRPQGGGTNDAPLRPSSDIGGLPWTHALYFSERASVKILANGRTLNLGGLMRSIRSLNAAALGLITHDVVATVDEAMTRDTPCAGWTVADLIQHMNDEHEAIIQTVLGPLDTRAEDPREDFPVIAARWTLALELAGPTVMIPKAGAALATDQVRAIHFVDMLVHRWDLARATGRDSDIDPGLAETALPIARSVTAPSNPYGLVGLAYRAPEPEAPEGRPIDNLAALLGRNPSWVVSSSPATRGVE